MPDETMKNVAERLLEAMQAEREGQHFYLMAAQTTQDPKGREVFLKLAQEELDHARFLRAQYRSVIDTDRPDAKLKLGAQPTLSGPSPIFSDQIRTRLKDAHFEMTALAVGIQLELAAKNFYAQQAAETDNIVFKTLFLELAEWETGHYRALLAQQEALKDEYWADGGFAPF
ncbi:MAG: ferritin family protein [Proteobacteria bacterium]|nr:ferritin family protein [Pseudomonadota bacterium]